MRCIKAKKEQSSKPSCVIEHTIAAKNEVSYNFNMFSMIVDGPDRDVYDEFCGVANRANIINGSLAFSLFGFDVAIQELEEGFFSFVVSLNSKVLTINPLTTTGKMRMFTDLTSNVETYTDLFYLTKLIPQLVSSYLFFDKRADLKPILPEYNDIELDWYFENIVNPMLKYA